MFTRPTQEAQSVAKKIANRLDDALISGAITHDQYLAAGGRSPERALEGLRRGSDSIAKKHYITEYNDPSKYYNIAEQKKIYNRAGTRAGWDSVLNTKAVDEFVQGNMRRAGLLNRINNFFALSPSAVNDAHAYPERRTVFVNKNPSKTGLERLKDLLNRKGTPSSSYDPYLYELTRRHELDEVRFRKDKLRLDAHGHSSPRVILQEHANLMHMPPTVKDRFRRFRALTVEAPVYSALTDGDFVYGKSMSGSKNRLAKLIADSGADIKGIRKTKLNRLLTSPDFLKHLKNVL